MCIPNRKKEAVIAASDIKDWISYNPKTGEFRWIKDKNNKVKAGSIAGYLNPTGYVVIKFNGVMVLAHRLAWFYTHESFPSGVIDHMNGLRSDNRISNIRDATNADNSQNKPQSAHWLGGYLAASENKCKSRNIYKVKGRGRFSYVVKVELNKKQIYFGYWDTLEEALAVRDEMLKHGWSPQYFEQKYPHKVKKRKAACAE